MAPRADPAGLGGPGRLLITTNHLRDFAGSEIVTLELVELFLSKEWFVDVYTHDLGSPVLDELEKIPSWGRLRILVAALDELFDEHYDLIWIQHSIVPEGLIRRLQADGLDAPMIWHHMSSFLDVELPRHAQIENSLARLSMGMSVPTVERLEQFGIDPDHIVLFDNPAPDSFGDFDDREPSSDLRSVLVVSNHPPEELREAGRLLEKQGIRVEVLGNSDTRARVTADLLAPYDAVVTIGKTVPYGLSMGIPCYVYDHFGGPGWLSEQNYEASASDAFSGRRAQEFRTPATIAAEITGGYRAALDYVSRNRPSFVSRWRLSDRVERLLMDPRISERRTVRLASHEAVQLKSLVALHRDIYPLVVSNTMARAAAWALTSRVYFDMGQGFVERDSLAVVGVAESLGEGYVFDIPVPAGTFAVRFDPIEGTPCLVGGVSSPGRRIYPVNGRRHREFDYFGTADPQYEVGGSWMRIDRFTVRIGRLHRLDGWPQVPGRSRSSLMVRLRRALARTHYSPSAVR